MKRDTRSHDRPKGRPFSRDDRPQGRFGGAGRRDEGRPKPPFRERSESGPGRDRPPRDRDERGFKGASRPHSGKPRFGERPSGEGRPFGERRERDDRSAPRGEGFKKPWAGKPGGSFERRDRDESRHSGPRDFRPREDRPRGEGPRKPFRDNKPFSGKREDGKGERASSGFRGREDRERDSSFRTPRSSRDSRSWREKKPRPEDKGRGDRNRAEARPERPVLGLVPKQAVPAEGLRPDSLALWGLHAVREALLNPARVCHALRVTESGEKALKEALATARERGLDRPSPQRLERDAIGRLLPPGSVHQGALLEVAPLPEKALHDVIGGDVKPDLVVVLDQVTDPHNVGAVLRSAAAFGAGAVVMTERHAPSTTGAMAKTASGAVEHIPVVHVVNLSRALTELREAGYWCVGLAEEGARDLASLDLSGRTALVMGAEGDGLRRLTRDMCDELAHLPTGGSFGTLNVSNAAAVALYEARRQKGAKTGS